MRIWLLKTSHKGTINLMAGIAAQTITADTGITPQLFTQHPELSRIALPYRRAGRSGN
jgi:hypothetical protein